MYSLNCRVTRDEDHKPVVSENEREQIIQEFLNRKREAEANKHRVAAERREPAQAPWAVNDWNYKINPAKNGWPFVFIYLFSTNFIAHEFQTSASDESRSPTH